MATHKRTVNFTTRCSRLAHFEMIMFIKDVRLRVHTVKHLFSKDEQPRWSLFGPLDGIGDARDRLITELGCPYFTNMKGRGNPPCLGCKEFQNGCETYLGDWDRRYTDMLGAVVGKALKEPVWIYYKGKDWDSDKDHAFLDFFSPESGIRVCAVLFDKGENQYAGENTSMVITAYASSSSLEEIVASIKKIAHSAVPCLPSAEGLPWQKTLYRMKRELL